jgi:hypothetical protein
MHTSSLSKRPLPNITTHSGLLPQQWRKTCRARNQNAHATHSVPHPPPSNLPLITHLRGHTQNDSGLRTPSKPPHALAATHYAPPSISQGSAPSSIVTALTTQSIPMGAPFHTPPFTTHTPTNSYHSSETAVPCNALLTSDPQWK